MPNRRPAALARTRRPLLALVGLLIIAAIGYGVQAVSGHSSPRQHDRTSSAAASRSSSSTSERPSRSGGGDVPESEVPESNLPRHAQDTIALIGRGGPFPYPRDGIVFGNVEGILPSRPRGYYHAYTVPTRGESDRGARRIITGGGDFYYTDDHCVSFRRVDPGR